MLKQLSRSTVLLFSVATLTLGASAFKEEWNSSSSSNFYYGSGGNKAPFTHTIGATSEIEPETKVLSLKTDPTEKPGAWQGPNYTSNNICHFGSYAARIKVPDASSQPNVGSVVGFYTYYNDEYNQTEPADINGNGLYDNSEIDFEWLIADPRIIYITAYTDYHGPTGETRKIGRIINLAEGIIYKTTFATTLGDTGTKLTGVENQPETIAALPGYDASKQFYTYGFDWKTDGIRWWMLHPETEDTIVLWDYKGPQERITQKKAYLMMNIWHTNNWPVHTNSQSTEAPDKQYSVEFDWTSYTPIETPVIPPSKKLQTKSVHHHLTVDNLILQTKVVEGTKIDLFRITGSMIGSYTPKANQQSIAIPIRDLSPGIYIWKLQNSETTICDTFIKR